MNFKTTLLAFVALVASVFYAEAKTVLQVGHFPNITHAQALVAHQMSRQGKGWFEQRLGDDVQIEWRLFNAGPSAMQSLFAGSVDITYVGPTPAINAFVKTRGKLRVVAGAAEGGSALLVNPKSGIVDSSDFRGKKIATPQLANTQDIATRAWLRKNGIKTKFSSGDANIIPTPNSETFIIFKSGKLDAAWTVEPWVTRIKNEAGAKVFLVDNDSVTTILVANEKVLKEKAELLKKFVQAHKELTDWINKNPEEAQKLVLAELKELTRSKMSPDLVKAAWKSIKFTSKLNKRSVLKFYEDIYNCGFIKKIDNISNIYAEQ